jgi:GntR family transcriptional repressor for pyruvate dehydrogenase complex
MPLKPITKTRLSEAAIEQIRELIASRELEPGSKLPSERELVGKLGISRASVREALRALEIIGLVEVKPGKGAFVKGLTGDLFVPLPNWLSDHKETLHNHFEARMVLEPAAAGFAALRASELDIRKLKDALSLFNEKLGQNDLIGLIESDIRFHRLIGNATGNKTIMMLMDTITRFLLDGWKATLRIKGRPLKTLGEHGEILEAIHRRDEIGARRAMERHLSNAVSSLRKAGLPLEEK